MNTKRIAGLSLLIMTVSACSTTAAPPSGSQSLTTFSKADRYQLAVQDQARVNGVEVHWVNPPDDGDLVNYDLPTYRQDVSSGSN